MSKPQLVVSLEQISRRRRFDILIRLSRAIRHRPIRILDVGGTHQYWLQNDIRKLGPVEIVLLNLTAPNVPDPFISVVGDARDLSRFPDASFDIAYSNSVINLMGNWLNQERMAKEIRRVGLLYAVQVPNRRFLLDWRTLVPCFHWLPVDLQSWCFQHMRVGLYPRIRDNAKAMELASRVRDLTRDELLELFPGGSIESERILGMAKAFVVYGSSYQLDVFSALAQEVPQSPSPVVEVWPPAKEDDLS